MNKREIEAKATQTLRDHGMLNMVVDPVRLANSAGLRVYNAKFGVSDVHGLIAMRGGKGSVYVNADDHPVRKRFTIAHELGHFFLHLVGADGEFIDDADNFRVTVDPDAAWTIERRHEWEANSFAAALLMNEDIVRQKWPEVRNVEGMARWFQVSQPAMAIRLNDLGLAS